MTDMKELPILHLICGLPGSGKTTFAKELEQTFNAVCLSPDEWLHRLGFNFYDEVASAKVEGLQWELAQMLLRRGDDVILENGFWSKEEREGYRDVANGIGVTTKIHFLDVPMAELRSRIARRNQERAADTPEVDPASLDELGR
ncbi:MAG: ATP-binding protein [Rhodopseudomonas sp.]|uniref:AAA family ATPase n=1 Tax=Rhodopseudomonas sp. TaxID=1078 RepID=UPI0039E593BB